MQRSKGQSVIATAAYHLHAKLKDETTGQTFYFRPKVNGEVRYRKVYLCADAPAEFDNPEKLWNSVTKCENKSSRAQTAQLARNVRICFPQGLSLEDEVGLLEQFVSPLTTDGMIIQAVIHDKGDGNPHLHLLMTMRQYKNGSWQAKSKKIYDLDEYGNKIPLIDPKTGSQKVDAKGRRQWRNHKKILTDWDRKDLMTEWRDRWAELCNAILPPGKQITAKSYAKQAEEGITIEQARIPMRHEGYQARKIESAGGISEICEYNRAVKRANEELERIEKEERSTVLQTAKELTAATKKQEEINEQIRHISDRFIDRDRTGGRSGPDEGNVGGMFSAAIRKLRSQISALNRRIIDLGRIINGRPSTKEDLGSDTTEIRDAIIDSKRSNATVRSLLNQRTTARMARRGSGHRRSFSNRSR